MNHRLFCYSEDMIGLCEVTKNTGNIDGLSLIRYAVINSTPQTSVQLDDVRDYECENQRVALAKSEK